MCAVCWPAHCVPNICMRVEEGLGLVGVRCVDLCGPPLKRLEKFDKAFCQKCYALLYQLTKKWQVLMIKALLQKRRKAIWYCVFVPL